MRAGLPRETQAVVSLTADFVMPLFHTGGLNCHVTPVFFHGGTVIVMREFDAPLTLAVLADPAMA